MAEKIYPLRIMALFCQGEELKNSFKAPSQFKVLKGVLSSN